MAEGLSQAKPIEPRPTSVAEWVELFSRSDLPVLSQTAERIERLRKAPRLLNAASLADVVTDDPLMTVKLLRYMQSHRSRHQMQALLDVRQVLLMIGFETFFRDIPTHHLAESCFGAHPEARAYCMQTVRRAQRASIYAADWAQRIHNLHAEEIKVSALLTHVAEILMWCFDPLQMLEIRRLQALDRSRRSRSVQLQVLGFAGVDLQRQLVVDWRLPELLLDLMDPAHAAAPQVRNVNLAVRLARHSAQGWHDAALPDDFREIAELLHMEPGRVMSLVRSGPAAVLR